MSVKLKRQLKIKEILSTKIVATHEVILKLLKADGVDITQATLSRDFADLGVIRTNTEIGPRYIVSQNESGKKILKLVGLEIISVQHNESMIIIRTLAGRAQGVAHFIDRLNKPEILGTVGGDDTVMVIPDSIKNINKVVQLINRLMSEE